MIDLIFSKNEDVRRIWHDYFDMLNNEGLNNPAGHQQWGKKNIELIAAMAAALGYGKAMTHLDVDRVYSPVGHWQQMTRRQEIQSELLRVLKATARIDVDMVTPTSTPSPGQDVQRLDGPTQ